MHEPIRMAGVGEIRCRGCGKIFALYSYSLIQPHGYDTEGKPYYDFCHNCDEPRSKKEFDKLIGVTSRR